MPVCHNVGTSAVVVAVGWSVSEGLQGRLDDEITRQANASGYVSVSASIYAGCHHGCLHTMQHDGDNRRLMQCSVVTCPGYTCVHITLALLY